MFVLGGRAAAGGRHRRSRPAEISQYAAPLASYEHYFETECSQILWPLSDLDCSERCRRNSGRAEIESPSLAILIYYEESRLARVS